MAQYIFKMPDIGEGIVETEVVEWHVAAGDDVAEDAPLADVMTDKATVEITSPVSGKVIRVGCDAGAKMVIGADFVEFDLPGSASVADSGNGSVDATTDVSKVAEAQTDIVASESQPSAGAEPSGSTNNHAVAAADRTFDTPSLPPTKPKIRVAEHTTAEQLEASAASAVRQTVVAEQELSSPPATANTSVQTPATPAPHNNHIAAAVEQTPKREIIPASPVVRRLARDLGLELSQIPGTGPAGRVTKEDLKGFLNLPANTESAVTNAAVAASGVVASAASATPAQDVTKIPAGDAANNIAAQATVGTTDEGVVEDLPVIGLRRLIAERMQLSKQRIPHFSYVEEVAVDAVESLRRQMNDQREQDQPKLSLLHFVLLAVSRTVLQWPQCNAQFDDENSVLRQFERVHAGVATMTPNGLMVPVVKNCCQLSVWEIANEVNRLAELARAGRLARDQLTGSTITVTSLGTLAGVTTTPVINRPETSIIGPNKMMDKVQLVDGQPVNTRVMNISSSFDHRVVDGYDAACFVQAIKEQLEQPGSLIG